MRNSLMKTTPKLRQLQNVWNVVLKIGENVEVVGLKDTKSTVVTGLEMLKNIEETMAGDNLV